MYDLTTYGYIAAILVLAAILTVLLSSHVQSNSKYPPGPPKRLFFGNLGEIPRKKPWLAYTEWAKTYGDIMHLKFMKDDVIVLSSIDVARDLLDKRSRLYSGRPNENLATITGWDFLISLQDYSDRWRKNRKVYQQTFRPDAVAKLLPTIRQSIAIFLRNLSKSPAKFRSHIDALSGGLSLKIMYGIDTKTADHPLISVGQTAVHTLDVIRAPRFVAVVKTCPFIMSVPRWVPLLGVVKQEVEDTRRYLRDLRDLPMEHVEKDMEAGKQGGGMISQILRDTDQGDADSEGRIHRLKDMASSTYAASSETTASTIATFFLAMARDPQAQRCAQQEIDSVVGRSRLPAIEDRGSLPYIEAIYIEILRLRPPSPMGVPHQTTEPDHYRGYYIPQGATVVANIWAMTHDERVYPEPEEFKPERFLNTDTNINDIIAYGFGRRVCVGRHLADALLWLTFASVLACFNIEKEKDEQGNDIDIPVLYSDGPGTFSRPLPFRCSVTPRHTGIEGLIF